MSIINILNELDTSIIDLSEIKNFLRIDFDEDDNLLNRLLKSAIKQCELYISRSITQKTYRLSLYNRVGKFINLLYFPVTNVTSIDIIDKNNNTIKFKNYTFDQISNKVTLNNIPTNFYRIDITYEAGYTKIPDDIKQALLFHVAKMYDDKIGYSPIPKASLNIYKNYKIIRM